METATLSRRSWWPGASVALIVVAAVLVRARLLDVPLDRDEGEYAFFGAQLLDGIAPFQRAWHMKMPGIYVLFALGMAAFGRTIEGVHAALTAVNAISIVLVFLLGRRLSGAAAGLAGASLFAALSLHPWLLGLAAYAEPFLLPFVLGGCLVLAAAGDTRSLAPFVVKQTGGAFVLVPLAVVIAQRRETGPRLAAVIAGAVVPTFLVCAWMLAAGTFERFWFWTFTYAVRYGGLQTFAGAVFNVVAALEPVLPTTWPLLLLAIVGAVVRRDRFLWLVLAVSLVAVSIGFNYRAQYFLLVLPALCLLAGAGALALAEPLGRWPRARPLAVVAAVLVVALPPLVAHRDLLFQASGPGIVRALHDRNPFPEAVELAAYLRRHAQPGDRLAVIGSEPQIYFYANLPPATGYVYMYPLMEAQPYAHGMQEALIRDLVTAKPRWLVFVNVHASWLATPRSDPTLARWFGTYWPAYDRVGFADIVSRDTTRYVWDAAARDYVPQSPLWVAVFRRKE